MGMLDGILDAVGVGTTGVPWGSIVSGASSFFGQQSANESNQQIAQNNSAFNADQARITREFNSGEAKEAREWANWEKEHSYQQTVADMKAAGLNPMLAYAQGPTSTPGGASASGPAASAVQPAAMQNAAGAGVAAAQQAAQMDLIQAQVNKTNAEKDLTEAQTNTEKGRPANVSADTDRIRKQAELFLRQGDLTDQQLRNAREEINRIISATRNLDSDTKLNQIQEILRKYDVPQAKSFADFYKSEAGKLKPYTDYGFESAGKVINSAFRLKAPKNITINNPRQ